MPLSHTFSSKLIREFFIRRFNRQPESDRFYFEEWVDRFYTGNPTRWMDSKSLEVYMQLIKDGVV